ncbi:MAG TPA: prepilin-type N-terminal cleavage/methylation domain-containing protein [Planctomycetota bacterium]
MSSLEGRGATPVARQPLSIRQCDASRGFTLLELMIVVAILAIVASMGVPQYLSALRIARIGKARHDLVTIAHAISSYQASNGGHLPLTLYQVGFGGRLDPWGLPYCYLNYGDGTGDGLHWAIQAGLVDPLAVVTVSMGDGGAGARRPRLAGVLGSLFPQSPGTGIVSEQGREADGTSSGAKVTDIVSRVVRTVAPAELADLTSSMVSGASVFTRVPVEPTRRRDRYLFPLNTDYDLFSLGPNGLTSVSLGETLGQDDVIRANNGGFFGPASEY